MQALTFFFAFVAVLALIGAAAWLVRQFAGNRLGANTNRGRMPRLAVIDAAAVDGRRRLVLVRRDNVEHLLMIGGPTDIVVEPNIVRAMPGRDQMPPRPAVGGAEPPPRIAPLPDAGNWSDGDGPPAPTCSITPNRKCPSRRRGRRGPPLPTKCAARRRRQRRSDAAIAAILWPASRRSRLAAARNRAPRLRGEPMPSRVTSRNEPMMPRPPRPSEAAEARRRFARRTPVASPPPPPPPPPPAPSPALSSADQNLAEMAQRLEAALRRPAGDAGEPRIGAPPVAPEPPPSRSPPRGEPPMAPPVATPRRRAALRISKTRWHPCWAVQRPLREVGDLPA